MNGEIDIIPSNSLRKILSGPAACGQNHPTLAMHIHPAETSTFSALTTSHSKDCPDYECSSSGILSAGSDVNSEDNNEFLRGEKINESRSIESSCNRITPSNSSQISPQPNSFAESNNCTLPVPDCSSNTEVTSSQLLSISSGYFPRDLNDTKYYPCAANRLEDLNFSNKINQTSQEDATVFTSDTVFSSQSFNSLGTDSTVDTTSHVGSISQLRQPQFQLDQRIPRLDQDLCGLQSSMNKFNPKNLQLYSTSESDVVTTEHDSIMGTMAMWNKPGSLVSTSDDTLPFCYNTEALPSINSNNLTDPVYLTSDLNMSGSTQNTMTAAVAAAVAAKRAITGGHQASKFCSSNRPTTWSNGTQNASSTSTLGSIGTNQWNTGGGNGGKVGVGSFGSSQSVSSTLSPNGTSPTPWTQLLAQQQQPQTKGNAQNITNMLSAMNLGNGNSLNGATVRSNLNTSNTNASGFTAPGINKNGPNGFSNIYSMFPKRPQHRMMAHWQQQQQHHPSFQQQNQTNRNSNIANGIHQLSGNRIPTSVMELANMAPASGASGDAGNLMNFSGGFANSSVLQSLSTTVGPNSSINQLTVGSAGDSFASLATSGSVTANENTSPLDTFKFGLDQQLMEVIKSFETSGIGNGGHTGTNTNNNNDGSTLVASGFDDVINFGEVDQQFPTLGCLNPMSMLGHNAVTTSPIGPSGMNGTNNHAPSLSNLTGCSSTSAFGPIGANPYSVFQNVTPREEGYSRKVFVGGLPPDIDEEEITTAFRRFGPLIVDWPHKTESKAYFPPKGYCFLLFQDERSVQSLINACIVDEGKYYWCVSSPTMKDKPVQIRPWNLADSDFVMDGSQPLDPRKTIFVGGVPRPLRAIELALIMDRLYGGVCYAGIDTDPELKYPKGAGRVAFSNQQSYIAAISARFVQLQHNEIDKRVEVKPYVLDNQMCDECQGARCGGKFAPFFCANVTCLQYYCEQCWVQIHSRHGREYHKPLVKEGAERPRPALYRW